MIRITRGEALALREEDYVRAAVANGAERLRRSSSGTSCPNMSSTLIVQATVAIPAAIIGEAVLSFLGLGVQPPTPSWGVMLSDAQSYVSQAPRLAVFPGLAIFFCSLSFNLLGDGLRDVLDPRTTPMSLLEVRDLSVRFDTDDGAGARGRPAARSTLGARRGARHRRRVRLRQERERDVAAPAAAARRRRSAGTPTSTAVDLLAAPPARGCATIRGREIAFVFQEPMTSLNPAFRSATRSARCCAGTSGSAARRARRRAIELLDLVGIPAPERRVDEYPHQLSGGMRQRVMIAMALACDPKILIADEPTTALDVTIQAGILDLMRDIRERLGTAIVLITHNLGVVADIADRVVVMYAGRKVEEAPVHDLFARPQHPYTIGLLGAMPGPARPTSRAGCARSRGACRRSPSCRRRARSRPAARAPTSCTRSELPELREIGPAHLVACFHPGRMAPRRER